jgi:hypothetical protein
MEYNEFLKTAGEDFLSAWGNVYVKYTISYRIICAA